MHEFLCHFDFQSITKVPLKLAAVASLNNSSTKENTSSLSHSSGLLFIFSETEAKIYELSYFWKKWSFRVRVTSVRAKKEKPSRWSAVWAARPFWDRHFDRLTCKRSRAAIFTAGRLRPACSHAVQEKAAKKASATIYTSDLGKIGNCAVRLQRAFI